jgi:S-adenosylmethionine decarboxylase
VLGGDTSVAGQEWLIDASGCSPARLRDQRELASLFERLIVLLDLKVIGSPRWHVFPKTGGITGLALLSESHLAIHTFPEHGFAALNVYSCRRRVRPDLERIAVEHLGAASVAVQEIPRGGR